jgi:hypothetical protein
MQLGTKGKNVDSFVDKLRSEGETVTSTVPITTGAGGATGKAKTQGVSVSDAQKGK